METSTLVATIASVAALALPLIFQESLKEIIKKSFSDRSPQQVRKYFVVFLIICFVVVSVTGFGISAATTESKEEEVMTLETDPTQSDFQTGIEFTETLIEKGEDYIDNKRTHDSITLANREKRWVYKIGDPKDNESDAWEAAMELSFFGDIFIFKEERKSYVIICDPILGQEQLEASLDSYKMQLDSVGLNYRISIIDLMTYCSKKENIVETEAIDKRKHDETFRCLTCDK